MSEMMADIGFGISAAEAILVPTEVRMSSC